MLLTDGLITLTPLTAATRGAFAEASRASAEAVGAWMTPALVPTSDAGIDAFVRRWEAERAAGTGAGYRSCPRPAVPRSASAFSTASTRPTDSPTSATGCGPRRPGGASPRPPSRFWRATASGASGSSASRSSSSRTNAASRRVAEKAGAQFEGVLRSRLVSRGAVRDAAMYALLPGDGPGA